ncbi:hypothetical protein AJ87_13265 [Rhizobium yanglingense]|nr:hypothetical protein AJ87_13265 [Rhizobium yanglingense]
MELDATDRLKVGKPDAHNEPCSIVSDKHDGFDGGDPSTSWMEGIKTTNFTKTGGFENLAS